MRRAFKPGIRHRLWIALGVLAASTLFVGAVAWVSLDRANSRLDQIHRQTLTAVAQSLNLSKQSGDLATSTPFLLRLRSPYLVQQEGQEMLAKLDPILRDWRAAGSRAGGVAFTLEQDIIASVGLMKLAISDLIEAVEAMNVQADVAIGLNARISELEARLYARTTAPEIGAIERRAWLGLQAMANQLAAAGRAKNLLGVGENRRILQDMQRGFGALQATEKQKKYLDDLRQISIGKDGLFEIRRLELAQNLISQNAIFRIRFHANTISDLAAGFAENAENLLSLERRKTTKSIRFAKVVIAIAGLASASIALISALYVSGYVTRNIRAISQAMLKLAQGDRGSTLRGKPLAHDEIGSLHQSFRVFRANALRLDRSNRQLHQKNALFETVFAKISDGIAVSREDGEIRTTNSNVDRVLHIDTSDLPKKFGIKELLEATVFGPSAKAAGIGKNFRGTRELEGGGQILEIRCNELPDGGGVWLFSDITERRKLEERLHQIQHIESLGKVTGEVAHDFGNVLSAISANVHLLQQGPQGNDKARLQRISNAVDIGTHLTQRLLAFARQQALAPEVVELNELIEGLGDLISIGLKDSIELICETAPENLCVRVDPGQLESAILNLCLNSNQAITGKGTVRISVSRAPDDTVQIAVSDTGCGMEPAVLARATEPFFTGQADGEGTGLGLSMVYGFIKQTGGDIQIESRVGQGTTIRLALPLWCAEEKNQQMDARIEQSVLLVEDDVEAMERVTAQLRNIGYRVIRAKTFALADRLLDEAFEAGEGFDALVTDLHLDQGHTGWALAKKCLEKSRRMKIIVASGRMPKKHPFSDGREPRVLCLVKPLSEEDLNDVLGGHGNGETPITGACNKTNPR